MFQLQDIYVIFWVRRFVGCVTTSLPEWLAYANPLLLWADFAAGYSWYVMSILHQLARCSFTLFLEIRVVKAWTPWAVVAAVGAAAPTRLHVRVLDEFDFWNTMHYAVAEDCKGGGVDWVPTGSLVKLRLRLADIIMISRPGNSFWPQGTDFVWFDPIILFSGFSLINSDFYDYASENMKDRTFSNCIPINLIAQPWNPVSNKTYGVRALTLRHSALTSSASRTTWDSNMQSKYDPAVTRGVGHFPVTHVFTLFEHSLATFSLSNVRIEWAWSLIPMHDVLSWVV